MLKPPMQHRRVYTSVGTDERKRSTCIHVCRYRWTKNIDVYTRLSAWTCFKLTLPLIFSVTSMFWIFRSPCMIGKDRLCRYDMPQHTSYSKRAFSRQPTPNWLPPENNSHNDDDHHYRYHCNSLIVRHVFDKFFLHVKLIIYSVFRMQKLHGGWLATGWLQPSQPASC